MDDLKFLVNCLVEAEQTPEDKMFIDSLKWEGKYEEVDAFLKIRFNDFDKKLRIDALREVLKKKYYNYYKTLIETENVEELLPTLKKIKEMEDAQTPDIKKSNIMFITLAPPKNEIDIHNFIKRTLEFCEFKYIQKYVFVCEQRYNGEPNEEYKEIGDGAHIHILLDKGKHKLSDVKRDIKRKFASYKMIIDFSFRHPKDILKTQEYIIGDKKDVDKQRKQIQDKIWREKIGILKYYGQLFNED